MEIFFSKKERKSHGDCEVDSWIPAQRSLDELRKSPCFRPRNFWVGPYFGSAADRGHQIT